MIRSTLRRAAAAVAALVFALLALPTLAAAQTPPEVLEAQAIKGAAKVQYTSANPGTDPVRIVISRVVREYALVDVYLEHEGTPTSVVVKREGGTWSGVAGPATAFPAGQRGGAPDDLFDYANPYAWQNAEPTIVSYADQYPRYEAQFAGFGYPGGAGVQPIDNSNLRIVGPESAAPNFSGPVYDIAVRATGEKILGPMDDWGYAKMLQTIAAREAQSGPGGPGTQPVRAVYFQLPNANVFQIDWAGGDSLVRDFWIGPPGGGIALFVTTRVYPVENNPGAPTAESAVTLFLYTLQFPDVSIAVEPEPAPGPAPVSPGMPTTGHPLDLPALLLLAAALPIIAGAATRLRAARHR